jgi:N-acetylglucosamine kinase-like BadF-type ATPase
MILIADSGSTKTDWCLVENGKIIQRIFTKGINPFYQTDSEIRFEIEQNLAPQLQGFDIDRIFFYGAGCSFPEKKAMVSNALGYVFIHTLIEVQSDLLGAARGLLLNNEGVACILGTGSNSCHYNGNEIVSNVSPLGYMLGDEGSGAVLSKIFVADCLKNQVSEKTKNAFFEKYELTPATIMENVYKKPFPNRYLAQFTPFLSENINQKEIYNVVYKSFVDFFERNVQQYPYQELETSFVGSVAFHLKEVLESAAEQCGVKIGKIMKSPMEGLIKYHDVAM